MDIKRISDVIIMQEAVKADGNMFIVRIDCQNRGFDSSPYTVSYYVLGPYGGLYDVTHEINSFNMKELNKINKVTNNLLYKLGAMLGGNLHESEYC